ncbi:MAG: 3-dehydroquinate synthase [Clostridia bacterium]|nr:3-dehydroquinate synthase [Clostridia bacterium]
MLKLKVKTSTKYQITIGSGLEGFNQSVDKYIKGDKVAIIMDTNVSKLYKNLLEEKLSAKKVFTYIVPAGENSKSKEQYFNLLEKLCSDGFTRHDTIIAFGGGVVGDLSGFVASTYMRGIALIQVPTTILSAVDSSVGGKTAINLENGKNLVGAFYQPRAVYVNTEFLKTLPDKEIKSGFGEIIKYALLSKKVTLDLVKNGISEKLIYECLKIKRDIVSKDEKESSLRALLNLGHTVGHAIESLSKYQISHGECVVKGLIYTLKISQKVFNLTQSQIDQINKIINCYNHDTSCEYSAEQIMNKVCFDKKGDGKAVKFVLLKDVGNPKIVSLTHQQIKECIE